jgi:hypothetical protein
VRGAAAAGAAAASAAAVCVHFTASCIHARSSEDMAATAARAAAPMPATQCASASMPGEDLNDREGGWTGLGWKVGAHGATVTRSVGAESKRRNDARKNNSGE